MKMLLKSKTVHGADRGGEDLYLLLRFETQEDPRTLADLTKTAREAFEACWEALPSDLEETGEGDLYLKDDHLVSVATSYGFAVDQAKEDLWQQALELVQGDDWGRKLKNSLYWTEGQIYVDGNAD